MHDNSGSGNNQDNKTLHSRLVFVHKHVRHALKMCEEECVSLQIESKCDLFLTLIPRSNVCCDRSIFVCFVVNSLFLLHSSPLSKCYFITHTHLCFFFVWPQTQVLTSNKVICTCGLCKETHVRLFLHVVDLIRSHYRTTLMMANFDWFSRW